VEGRGPAASGALENPRFPVQPPANQPPTASISAAPLADTPWVIAFDAYGSSDADGSIATYSWNFGDGDVASGDYVEHEYLAAGDYTVVLTVIDDSGATAQDQILVTVVDPAPQNTPPVAAISASATERLAHFEWDYPADGTAAGFRFYQNGAVICEVADPAARAVDCPIYVDSGLVQIWMASFDAAGAESAAVSEIFTFDSTGLFDGTVTGDAPLSVRFSAGTSYDADGTITAYEWNFGDGSVGTGRSIDHVYTAAGTYTVTLTVTDDAGETSQATTDVTITGNHAPVANASLLTTDENTSITGTLSAMDADGDALTYAIAANASMGTATITNPATGVFTYVPNKDAVGKDSFSFTVNDGRVSSDPATVSIEILKVNTPPVAADLTVNVDENTTLDARVTATDADGDPLSYAVVSGPLHGTLDLAVDGGFSYTPASGFYGADSFTFKAGDGTDDSNTATVTISVAMVNAAPVAVDDSLTTEVDMAAVADVLANDTDADGDALSITIAGGPAHGTAEVTGTSITYTPNPGYIGADEFLYEVSDGFASAGAAVAVTVTPPREKVSVNWDYAGADAVGFRLYYNGEAVCETSDAAARSLTCYIPKEEGAKTFAMTALDAAGGETALSNTLTYDPAMFNTAPVAVDDTVSTDEDVAVSIDVLANDTDADGDSIALVSVGTPALGAAAITDGVIVYTPHADANGTDTFSYGIVDSRGAAAQASVTVRLAAVNDAPVVAGATLSTTEDTAVSGTVAASDADNDTLSYSVSVNGSLGVAVVDDPAAGGFTYTPNADANGTDSFTIAVSDGKAVSKAIVTIEIAPVNDPPVVLDDTITVAEDGSATFDPLANDADADNDTLTVTALGTPAHGTVAVVKGGVSYTPVADYNGADTFSYTVEDGNGGTATGTVTVSVTQVNDPPAAADDSATVDEDGSVLVDVLLNDTDVDGDTLTIAGVGPAAHGVVAREAGGLRYTPAADYNGVDTFSYTVEDGNGGTATATVHLTVAPVNDAPAPQDDSAEVESGLPLTLDVLANDIDVDGDTLTILSVAAPANGTVALDGGRVVYTALDGFVGDDSFEYTVVDGHRGLASATVRVSVTQPMQLVTFSWDYTGDPSTINGFRMYVNGIAVCETTDVSARELACKIPLSDSEKIFSVATVTAAGEVLSNKIVYDPNPNIPPVAAEDTAETQGVAPVTIDVLANDTDADGDRLSLAAVAQPMNGTVTLAGESVVYTANSGFTGTDSFTYTVTDGKEVATGMVTVDVKQPTRLVSFSWDFDPATAVSSFRLYVNGAKACEIFDPAAREASCVIPWDEGSHAFSMTYTDLDGAEKALANVMTY